MSVANETASPFNLAVTPFMPIQPRGQLPAVPRASCCCVRGDCPAPRM